MHFYWILTNTKCIQVSRSENKKKINISQHVSFDEAQPILETMLNPTSSNTQLPNPWNTDIPSSLFSSIPTTLVLAPPSMMSLSLPQGATNLVVAFLSNLDLSTIVSIPSSQALENLPLTHRQHPLHFNLNNQPLHHLLFEIMTSVNNPWSHNCNH